MTPDLRVVRGEPDDVELAALVAGLAAGAAAGAEPDTGAARRRRAAASRRRWQDGACRLGDPLTPGPDAWRWSASR